MTKAYYLARMGELLRNLDVQHFTPFELCRVGTIHPSGVVLTAPDEALFWNAIPTIVRLEQVRRELGTRLRITSGYRPPKYNYAVGGSSSSYHMVFNAFDIVPLDGRSTQELYYALRSLPEATTKFGIGRYRDQGFVHFDTRGLIRHDAPAWTRVR